MASIRLIVYATLAAASLGVAMGTENTFHYHMSGDELRQVFHVDRHDQVPDYEIVHVHSGHPPSPRDSVSARDDTLTDRSAAPAPAGKTGNTKSRDVKHLRLSAFGQDMKLHLKKATGLFKGDSLKMWTVDSNATEPHQLEYTQLEEDDGDIGEVYQDEDNMAALLLQQEDGGALAVEGTIGHQLVVKPVPASLRHHLPSPGLADDEMFLDDVGEDLADDVSMDTGRRIQRRRTKREASPLTQQHIVFKRNLAADGEEQPGSDYAFMEPDQLNQKYRAKRSISKREAPYVIYPEILVIVDYDGYRLHGGDNVQIKRYFVSFWNGVDLRYKLLKGPKIRISIAGIIISRGRDATPYLERNRVGRDAIDSAAALTDMGKYLFRERRLPVYDIAVAVTKLDMCRRQYASDTCNRGTAGFAYVGGACVVNKRLEKVNSVAIIEDTGGFSGIIVGAHEVGHLLGAVHDGSPPPSYLGGPGAEKCRWEDGFIMSDLRHTDKGFKWSSCSVISFHHFLNGDTATCLFNSPHEDESLPRALPGKLLTLDAQCRKDRGTSACFKDDRVCAQLFCFDAGSGYCVAYRPAAEGSTCGDGQYCMNGRCMTEHENIIPDYSQNTPTYVRRNDADTSATQARPVYASLANATTQRYNWADDKTTQALSTTTTTQSPVTGQPKSTAKYFFKINFYLNTKNPYAVPHTTKNPYTPSPTTQSPYLASQSTKNPYVHSQSTKSTYVTSPRYQPTASEATKNPYTTLQTTKNPYTTSPSTRNPYISSETTKNFYQAYQTTKNPYIVSQTTPSPYKISQTTKKSYETTKNPYTASPNTPSPYTVYHTTPSPYSPSQTTPSPYITSEATVNPYSDIYNPNAITTKKPYSFYKMVTTKNPYDFSNFHLTHLKVSPKPQTTTKNPYYEYFKDLTTPTTKKPYESFVTAKKTNYNYNQFYTATTAVPYALSVTKPTPKPHVHNPYTANLLAKKIPNVVQITYETSATRNTEFKVQVNDTQTVIAVDAAAIKCEDIATNIGGSMSCSDFLLRYGFQYCQYRYMKRNCCASHRDICTS